MAGVFSAAGPRIGPCAALRLEAEGPARSRCGRPLISLDVGLAMGGEANPAVPSGSAIRRRDVVKGRHGGRTNELRSGQANERRLIHRALRDPADIARCVAQLVSVAHPGDELLTVYEVAEKLRLNPRSVRNMNDRGELKALRVGQRRVPHDAHGSQ
jgi:hypothetical protein